MPVIGITGSAGTGKTTLATALGRALGVPVLPEAMRAMLAAGFDFHRLTRAEHRDLLRRQATDLAAALARAGTGLITDRTPLDFLAFWLSNGFAVEAPADTAALAERCIAAMADYDRVVLLPWGAFPIAADGVRGTNALAQLHLHTLMEGLIRRWMAPERLLVVPEGLGADGRTAWVLARIGMAG